MGAEKQKRLEVGSEAWFEKVYPVWAESDGALRVWEKLRVEGRESEFREVVTKWVGTQVFFFLTEFGAGKTLSLQPTYQSELLEEEGEVVAYAFNIRDYGDQKKSQISFEGIDEAVRLGLSRIYSLLGELPENHGLVRVSPTEFYKDFNSSYDVVELYRVVSVREDGSRVMEGRYVVLDGVLSREERMFVANIHTGYDLVNGVVGTDGEVVEYSHTNLVMNPQRVVYDSRSEDPTLLHVKDLNNLFRNKFGRDLVKEIDIEMYHKIDHRVKENIEDLVELLMCNDRLGYVAKLKGMMFESQKEWAVSKGIDPVWHMNEIIAGRFAVGFEIGGFGESVWDPVAKKWYDGGGVDGKKHCFVHEEDYWGERCPRCLPVHKHEEYQNYLAA